MNPTENLALTPCVYWTLVTPPDSYGSHSDRSLSDQYHTLCGILSDGGNESLLCRDGAAGDGSGGNDCVGCVDSYSGKSRLNESVLSSIISCGSLPLSHRGILPYNRCLSCGER